MGLAYNNNNEQLITKNMKTTKANIELDWRGFNDMPGRLAVQRKLEKIAWGLKIVDTDRIYWKNENDTLVFQIDSAEIYRFGEKEISESLEAIAMLIAQTKPDEVDTVTHGAKKTYRLWWD